MFRDRPLTWLFIAATICVDLVLMVVESDRGLLLTFKAGLVLGQLAALAIWSVRGQQNRLARMSCLILATGLLTYLIDTETEKPMWIAFNTGYVCWIIFATLAGDLIRSRFRKAPADEDSKKRWQVPLIEFFGWTTLVAIISFGARYMDFDFLHWDHLELIVLLLAVPTCMTQFTKRDLSNVRVIKTIVLAIVVITTAIYMAKIEAPEGTAEYVIIFQSAYLILWMLVLSMDDARSRARGTQKSLPKLFNPQD